MGHSAKGSHKAVGVQSARLSVVALAPGCDCGVWTGMLAGRCGYRSPLAFRKDV